MSQFMCNQADELIVRTPVFVGSDDNFQVPLPLSRDNVRQHASVQTPERTVPELDVDDSAQSGNRVDKAAECRRPFGPLSEQFADGSISRPYARHRAEALGGSRD